MSESPDISSLGATLRQQMERLQVGPESFLPTAAVEMQKTLAILDDDQLMHVIVGAAIQLAARDLGPVRPTDVLARALEKSQSAFTAENWIEKLAPEVRRLSHAAREADQQEADLVQWVIGELKHLSAELRVPRTVDSPTLAAALRQLADALNEAVS